MACGRRFTTYERSELVPLYVVKKDGRREEFERLKLLGGLRTACGKRPISSHEIECIVEDIENQLRDKGDDEIPSHVIGEMVMDRLLKLDQVAYVRFASVYRQFKDLNKFMEELQVMLQEDTQAQD
jgi:transcriptional repressor NrdR